jgi:hypothetical protein
MPIGLPPPPAAVLWTLFSHSFAVNGTVVPEILFTGHGPREGSKYGNVLLPEFRLTRHGRRLAEGELFGPLRRLDDGLDQGDA